MLKILEKQQKGTPKYQNHLKPRTFFFFSFILFFLNFPVVLHFKQGYLECHNRFLYWVLFTRGPKLPLKQMNFILLM